MLGRQACTTWPSKNVPFPIALPHALFLSSPASIPGGYTGLYTASLGLVSSFAPAFKWKVKAVKRTFLKVPFPAQSGNNAPFGRERSWRERDPSCTHTCCFCARASPVLTPALAPQSSGSSHTPFCCLQRHFSLSLYNHRGVKVTRKAVSGGTGLPPVWQHLLLYSLHRDCLLHYHREGGNGTSLQIRLAFWNSE